MEPDFVLASRSEVYGDPGGQKVNPALLAIEK